MTFFLLVAFCTFSDDLQFSPHHHLFPRLLGEMEGEGREGGVPGGVPGSAEMVMSRRTELIYFALAEETLQTWRHTPCLS